MKHLAFCLFVVCPPLTAPTNGDLIGSGNLVGDSITVSCDRGYEVSGSATRICEADGSWNGTAFDCVEICMYWHMTF